MAKMSRAEFDAYQARVQETLKRLRDLATKAQAELDAKKAQQEKG